jgi:polyisoprenoid-binding protein YceI
MTTATLPRAATAPVVASDLASDRAWRLGGPGATTRLAAPVLGGYAIEASFGDLSGRLMLSGDGSDGQVEVRIDAASLVTGDHRRDRHLKSSAFLDTDRFPTLCFRSSALEPAGPGRWRVTGRLRIRDVERPVQLAVEANLADGCEATVRVHGVIDRSDFGLELHRMMERTFRVGTRIELDATVPADGCASDVVSPCATGAASPSLGLARAA